MKKKGGGTTNFDTCEQHYVRFFNVITQVYNDPRVKVLLREFRDVFKEKLEALPIPWALDHHIELQGTMPKPAPIYRLTPLEDQTLKEHIVDTLDKGLIRPSRAP